jgi:hypothetical protein
MRYLEAAVRVLSETGTALTVEEITEGALRRGLISTTGKTPIRSMSAALYLQMLREAQPQIERFAEQGPKRARRGSVRWRLADR